MTGGSYDPLGIRSSDIRGGAGTFYETWTPSATAAAYEGRLTTGSSIVGARKTKGGTCVWTDVSLHFGTFTGQVGTDSWVFNQIASACGLAGPNAAVEKNGVVYWYSPNIGFFMYNAGSPTLLNCTGRRYINNSIDPLQYYKVYGSYDAAYDGLLWLYPGDNIEVNRYVRLDLPMAGSDPMSGWSYGSTIQTAWLDRSTLPYPRSVTTGGIVVDQDKGRSANGEAMERFISYAPIEISADTMPSGTNIINLNKCIPDAVCEGEMELTLTLRRHPNGPATVKGPYPMTQTTEWIDFKAQGRQAGFTWRSFGVNDYWRIGNVRYNVFPGGKR